MIARSTGSKILSSSDVIVSDAPVRIGDSSASAASVGDASLLNDAEAHTPAVSVEHDAQGNVVRIHVRCGCGEDISLACDYG